MKEVTVFDCSRCGKEDLWENVCEYSNALLCPQCNNVRKFDDENPVLYPMEYKF